MTDSMVVRESTAPMAQRQPQIPDAEDSRYYPVYDEKRTGKLVNEVIAAVKDDRMNNKRALAADTLATARVQNQNDRVITACEKELRRDMPDERRDELFDRMCRACESSARESASSREFQRELLDHSHKLPWKIMLFVATFAVGVVGGAAIARAAA